MKWTVRELVAALRDVPQDALVVTEGCDCYGDVDRVEVREDRSRVYLLRPKPFDDDDDEDDTASPSPVHACCGHEDLKMGERCPTCGSL